MRELRVKLPKQPLEKENPLSEIDFMGEWVKALQQQARDFRKKYPHLAPKPDLRIVKPRGRRNEKESP